jgi:hypothetical protein
MATKGFQLNLEDSIRMHLVQDARTRDNDMLLCSKVWWGEGAKRCTSVQEFMSEFSHSETYTHPESIMRARRKIQEREPSLRGVSYEARKKKGGDVPMWMQATLGEQFTKTNNL